jgi:1-acyl-sn-glycerol-3-phosphate acyltransferase
MLTVTDRLGKLRSGYRAAGVVVWTLGDLAGVRLHQRAVKAEQRYQVWQRWMKAWTRGLLLLFGVESASPVDGVVPPAHGPRLVVSNHRSPLDIALLLSIFGGHVLSRDDLAHWPLIGRAARGAETIFVDRQSANSGLSAIRQIRGHLRQGRTVIVFPEGATFAGDVVRPFHAGAFGALKKLNVELIAVGIAYQHGCEFVDESFAQHFARVGARKKTPLSVCFGQSRPAHGSPADMAVEMQKEVQALVNQARKVLSDA